MYHDKSNIYILIIIVIDPRGIFTSYGFSCLVSLSPLSDCVSKRKSRMVYVVNYVNCYV